MIPSALIASTSVGLHTIFKSRHKNKKDAVRNRLRRMRTGQKVEAAIGFLPLIPLSLPLQTSVVNDSDASRRRRRRCSPLSLSLSQHRRERGPSASPHRMLIRLHSISSRLLTLKKRAWALEWGDGHGGCNTPPHSSDSFLSLSHAPFEEEEEEKRR